MLQFEMKVNLLDEVEQRHCDWLFADELEDVNVAGHLAFKTHSKVSSARIRALKP